MDDLVDILALQAEIIQPQSGIISELRDQHDLPILGTLLSAMQHHHARYLITGDKDLLALAEQHPILTPAQFWERHGGL